MPYNLLGRIFPEKRLEAKWERCRQLVKRNTTGLGLGLGHVLCLP